MKFQNVLLVLFLLLIFSESRAVDKTTNGNCSLLTEIDPTPQELREYEQLRVMSLKPTMEIKSFIADQGIFVTKRDSKGRPIEARIRVLSDNPNNTIEVTGDFNNWGETATVALLPDPNDPRYVTAIIKNIFHGMQYRLVLNGQQVIDPAALVQSTPEFNKKIYGRDSEFLNSVFWDIDGVAKYVQKNRPVDLRGKPVAISENDIMALARNWKFKDKIGPHQVGSTYSFIATSGIIQQLKSWGINAIEFLPITASVDGDVWSHRYLSYAPFAIDSRWGTPLEFAKMVDAFNEAGIAVIMDIVPGHFTQKGNKGVRDLAPIGKHNFKKADGSDLYSKELSEWNTFRYDYQNPYVRKYLIDSVLTFIKYYGISGVRIDNYGGIQALPGGQIFLKELITAIRNYAPEMWINSESFGGDSNITRSMELGGDGATTHNAGDFFGFIYQYAQKRTEELDMRQLWGLLRNPWGWRENAVLTYITNHDEAANSRGNASGAYFASLVNGGGWQYVEGKVRAFSALAMFSGSYYLDMPHLRILQEGTFYSNPAVEWDNLKFTSQKRTSDFLAAITRYYTSHDAFAFQNTHPNVENHIDYDNKIISLKRVDLKTGQEIYIVINLGDRSFENYRFGVTANSEIFKIGIDSDNKKFGGSGRLSESLKLISTDKIPMHDKDRSLNLPFLAPYSVTILESK